MTQDERIAALEARLQPLRERIDSSFAEVDQYEYEARSHIRTLEIYTSKAKHVALEALAEMRHIDEELKALKAGSNTTPSQETRHAKGRSRSRGGRG